MPKLQKYIQKIRKYKLKVKNLIYRIGISYPTGFELIEDSPSDFLLPCHLGVLFFGDFDISIYNKINLKLNQIFDSFFYSIRNLGRYNFSIKLFYKGVKKEYKELKKTSNKLKIHPTNKFYQILVNKRNEENLGMILAITELPIFSSVNDNILFLFGEAHLKHKCCIVSLLKLKEEFYNRLENKEILEMRIIKEIIHEVGHLILGPFHCTNNSCVLRKSKTIEEIDEKSDDLCNSCKDKIEQIREKFNF